MPCFCIIIVFFLPCATSLPCVTVRCVFVENGIVNSLFPSLKCAIGLPTRLPGLLLQNEAIRKCDFKEERPKQRLPRTAPESMLICCIRPYLITAVHVIHFNVILSGNSRNRDHFEAITIEDLLQALCLCLRASFGRQLPLCWYALVRGSAVHS